MSVWEYKTIARGEDELLTDEQLNKIGALGLELVSVTPVTATEVVVGKTVTKHVLHYFFKRAKAAKPAKKE